MSPTLSNEVCPVILIARLDGRDKSEVAGQAEGAEMLGVRKCQRGGVVSGLPSGTDDSTLNVTHQILCWSHGIIHCSRCTL